MAPTLDCDHREADVLRSLVSFHGMHVLDVGCGEGRTARRIARRAASVIGLDTDAECIESARRAVHDENSCPVEYLCEDAVSCDFPATSFDAVIFTRSL